MANRNIKDTREAYVPVSAPRGTINITRSAVGSGGRQEVISGGASALDSAVQRSLAIVDKKKGTYGKAGKEGVTNVKETRDKEKKNISALNSRLASYIDKAKYLENANKKLANELEYMKNEWGRETSIIKEKYGGELADCRKKLDAAVKETTPLHVRAHALECQNQDILKETDQVQKELGSAHEIIAQQNKLIADAEKELRLLRKRLSQVDNKKDTSMKTTLTADIAKSKADLDEETIKRINAESEKQSLQEEADFLKNVHEQEKKELEALITNNESQQSQEFWKNEMEQAVYDIQQEYEGRIDSMRGQMEAQQNAKLQEFTGGATKNTNEASAMKEEVKKLRGAVNDIRAQIANKQAEYNELNAKYIDDKRNWENAAALREKERIELQTRILSQQADLDAIMEKVQALTDSKHSLELEIAAYGKLLDVEDTRGSNKVHEGGIVAESGIQAESAISAHSAPSQHASSGGYSGSSHGGSYSSGGSYGSGGSGYNSGGYSKTMVTGGSSGGSSSFSSSSSSGGSSGGSYAYSSSSSSGGSSEFSKLMQDGDGSSGYKYSSSSSSSGPVTVKGYSSSSGFESGYESSVSVSSEGGSTKQTRTVTLN